MVTPFFLTDNRDKALIFLGVVLSICESASDPIATIIIGRMFRNIQDYSMQIIGTHEFLGLSQQWAYCLVGIAVYSAIVNACAYNIWVHVGYEQGHKARSKLFKILAMHPLMWFDGEKNLSGVASTHFKDIQDLEIASGIASYEIVAMTVGCFAQIGVAFFYSWSVTLICLAGIPLLVFVCALLSPHITKRILECKTIQELTSSKLEWIFSALETVRVFQRDKFEWLHAYDYMRQQCNVSIKFWILFRLQEGICRVIVLLVFLQGFYFGSYMVKEHGLSAGNVVTVFWACLNAASLVQTVVGHLIEWNKGNASAKRLAKAFEMDEMEAMQNAIGIVPEVKHSIQQKDLYSSEFQDAIKAYEFDFNVEPRGSIGSFDSDHTVSTTPQRHVKFSEVVFSYTSRRDLVLRGLDVDFLPGETSFVLGQSGSGKSTIAALLSKQYTFMAGKIEIDGHSIELMSAKWIARNVHICEQSPQLFDIPVYDNITLGQEYDFERLRQALQDSCADFVNDLPEKGKTSGSYPFSGGQIQRISLARARYFNAPITVYDESTSALDQDTQKKVLKSLLKYRKNKTTILITHDPSIIPPGYPVYIMNEGLATRYQDINEAKALNHFYKFDNDGDNKEYDANPDSNDLEGPKVLIYGESDDDDSIADTLKDEDVNSVVFDTKPATMKKIPYDAIYKSMPMKPIFFIGFIISLIHAVINPVFSYVFSKLVMGVINPGLNVTLWAMLVLMCAFLDGISSFGKVLLNVSTEKWLVKVKSTIVERILDFPGSRISHDDMSYYVKLLISDAEKTAEIITMYWPSIASMLIIGTMGFVWAIATNWKLSLVGISLLPAFVATNQAYKWLVKRWTSIREDRRSDVIRLVMDLTTLKGYRTMKIQHLEAYFECLFTEREDYLQAILPKMVGEIGIGYGVLKCFPYALETLLLWYGMQLIGKGYPTQAVITVFTLLMFTVVTIDQLTSSIGSVGPGFEAMPRLMSAYLGKDELTQGRSTNMALVTRTTSGEVVKTDHPSLNPLNWNEISFEQVGVEFVNGTHVLGNFSCKIDAGETVAIVGKTGAGKSTVARVLEMLEPNYSGYVTIDHYFELKDIAISNIRENVCLVSQMPLDFFDGTIAENLKYALDEHYESDDFYDRMITACKVCGIHDFIDGLEDKYETKMSNGGLLSGGQFQRLGIARALIRNPRVLLLDECTSALDPLSKQVVMDTIVKLKEQRNMIIIIITHQMDVAAIADRIIPVD